MTSNSRPRTSYLIGRVDRLIRRQLEDELRPQGISLPHYLALSVLAVTPGLSNAQLARRALMTPQGMNQAVNVLAERGLIHRVPHETNGRIRRIELSESGREVVRVCEELVETVEQRFLSGLTSKQRHSLDQSLYALAAIHPDAAPQARPIGS